MFKIWLINGPNLNMLGARGGQYGQGTYDDLVHNITNHAVGQDIQLIPFQSNHEGDLIDLIQQARIDADGLIINAGGYTHTSVSLHDALELLDKPKIEVHITNIYSRDVFRQKSLISPVVNAVIAGFGQKGYFLALDHMITMLKAHNHDR